MDRNTLRILSLDGGGARGYLSVSFLLKLQTFFDKPLWQIFDVIAGSSTGGLQALSYTYGKTIDEVKSFYLTEAPWVFTIRTAADVAIGSINASEPSNRPSIAQKIAILGNNGYLYRSTSTESNYGSARLKTVLTNNFGTSTLQNLKTNVLITSFRKDSNSPIIFSNLNDPNYFGQNLPIVDVALATSAAPVYLPPQVITEQSYIDGGVYQNNPAQLALSMGRRIKPLAKRFCILSLGTGLGDLGFDEVSTQNQGLLQSYSLLPFEQTIKDLVALFDQTMVGGQESVAKALSLVNDPSVPSNLYHYRFQPDLDQNLDTELDNTDSSFFTYLSDLATTTYNNDIDNITTFMGHLTI